jgi:PAS domain S-box-containing protein
VRACSLTQARESDPLMDILTLLVMAAFYTVFVISIVRYVRSRHALELAVVLVFSSTAAIFTVSLLNAQLPALAPFLGPVAVTMLVAQPVLMLRLVGLIVALPRWLVPAAVVGFVLAVVTYYVTERSVPGILVLVGYFALTEFLAAGLLIREGRQRLGFPRLRLTTAGVASLLFGLSILISGLASASRGGGGAAGDPAITVLSRSLALVAGLGYLAAFATPGWLRRLGHRSLAFDLVRSIVSRPSGTDVDVHWSALAAAAGNILGTAHIRIVDQRQDRPDGPLPEAHPRVLVEPSGEPARDGTTYLVEVPLRSERGPIAMLEARLPGRPLFVEDDVALIELLGSLTARSVEREQAIATLAQAELEVHEAAAVRASEARFRALLDAEPNAMLSVDPSGVVSWCTRSAERLFSPDGVALVGRRLDALVAPVNEARNAGVDSDIVRYETKGTRSDGSTFPAEVALSSMEFDGAPATLAVVTDISWREEADQLRDRFIGVLSHELRTPITAIFGGAQVLLKRGDTLDPAIRSDLVADVAGEAERLERMVENLLILARVERGAEVVDVSPVLLQRVLPAVVARERATWPTLDVVLEPAGALPPVAADEASIALIVRNLISNAGKYAGPSATVRISLTEDADSVAVHVRDDGPGVSPDEIEQLFHLYFRSGSSAATPGSGIGLFVCRELVRAMGGRMWGAALAGGGAEFGFRLPRYVERRSTSLAKPSVRPTGSEAWIGPRPSPATVPFLAVADPPRAGSWDVHAADGDPLRQQASAH